MSDFIFSRRLCGAEANTKECTVLASMEDDDVIDAVVDYNGYLDKELNPGPHASNV